MSSMRKLVPFLFLLPMAVYLVVSPGCANIVPPAGGPRDSLPPLLMDVTPPDSTRNFSGNRIVFTFDEYIELQNVQSQLVVSPSLPINPDVNYRLNTVTVRFRDTLERNTTYTFDFGDAIRDFNEGNTLKGFNYTLSTGPYIDSLELRGKVLLAETGRVDTTLIVMLHTNPSDSAVFRDRPRYVTKLNSSGEFVFRNLPPRTFHVYALKDESGTRRYMNDKQLFGFANDPVVTGTDAKPVTIYAYATASGSPAVIGALPTIGSGGRRTGGQTADTRLKFQVNLLEGKQDLLNNLEFRFESPLRKFDSSLVTLYTDSTFQPAAATRSLDSARRKLTIATTWKENTLYHVILDKEFADDSTGKKLLKTDTVSFTTRKSSDYGSLRLKFRGLENASNPVLQVVQNNVIYLSAPLKQNEFYQLMFPPGEYELRILLDENGNGVWDPGNFFEGRRQPEIVRPVERKITVRPNWQNEMEIQMTDDR
jgi:uncharacterized protein (DUF2141 family)